MFDTLAVSCTLRAAGIDPKHVEVFSAVVRTATEHADYATKADLADVRAELAALAAPLVRRMVAIADDASLGVDLNARGQSWGKRALTWALAQQHQDVVQALVALGGERPCTLPPAANKPWCRVENQESTLRRARAL